MVDEGQGKRCIRKSNFYLMGLSEGSSENYEKTPKNEEK
jgi:hypothetical protein